MEKNWEVKDGQIEFTELKKSSHDVVNIYDQYNEDITNIDKEIQEYETRIAWAQERRAFRVAVLADIETEVDKVREAQAVDPNAGMLADGPIDELIDAEINPE
ncbi:hypothetical protein UFOVP594_29 [uncultured Caudovirales phage]|uniref:Uncharacterized protein n=1 Tax=uncultured Caudovirales phage TaxID=2100421 RepID=A0A6J5N332_9CAUD|nr:hypothetical protein UFOVP594_29 [uncultured Caudovirales phage]